MNCSVEHLNMWCNSFSNVIILSLAICEINVDVLGVRRQMEKTFAGNVILQKHNQETNTSHLSLLP